MQRNILDQACLILTQLQTQVSLHTLKIVWLVLVGTAYIERIRNGIVRSRCDYALQGSARLRSLPTEPTVMVGYGTRCDHALQGSARHAIGQVRSRPAGSLLHTRMPGHWRSTDSVIVAHLHEDLVRELHRYGSS